MLKIYCTQCGSPTAYSLSKPKFCSSCGKPFNESFTKNVIATQKPNIQQKNTLPRLDIEDDYDDIGDEAHSVPNISRLNYEIESSRDQKIKIGDIIGTAEKRNKEKNKSKRLSKVDRKKFLEEFKKEAGAIRPKSRDKKNG